MNKATNSYSKLSTAALRRLFGWIELRYGGNIPVEHKTEVITVHDHTIHTPDLIRLLQHDNGVIAIHVKEFYHRETAIRIGEQLMQEAKSDHTAQNWNISTSRGLESSDVTTIGAYQPYNIASSNSRNPSTSSRNSKNNIQEYFHGVQKEHYNRRQMVSDNPTNHNEQQQQPPPRRPPFLWPLDLLRLQLDEAWPSGAGLARCDNNWKQSDADPNQNPPYGGGLPRIMVGPTRWRKGFVHVDEMGPLHTEKGLFSANIYLQLPDQANDGSNIETEVVMSDTDISQTVSPPRPPPQNILEIWPTRIMTRWDWYRNMLLLSGLSSTNIDDQIKLRNELGCDPITIAVAPGDLILFCVQRPHAAIGFQSGTRVSLQCFIQHHGIRQRLLIDS